jgi:hypothetical protein
MLVISDRVSPTLDVSCMEVRQMAEEKAPGEEKAAEDYELERLQKEIWEKTLDTQMHFNEMSVRSRQLGLSFVVASLGVVVVVGSAGFQVA